MTWEEFGIIFFKEYFIDIVLIYLANILSVWFFFRKKIYSIFDPLNILIINISSVFTVLFLLLYIKKIELDKFFQLITLNYSFLLSLKFFLNIKSKQKKIELTKKNEFKVFYILHTLIFFIIILFMIKLVGIKTLENKITAFNNIGWLNYFRTLIFPGQIILIIVKREVYKKKEKKDIFILVLIIIFFFISGGKTAIITYILYVAATYYLLYESNLSNKFLYYKTQEKKYL